MFDEVHLTLLVADRIAFVVTFMSINTASAKLNLAPSTIQTNLVAACTVGVLTFSATAHTQNYISSNSRC